MDYKKYFDLTDALYETYPDVWEDVCNLESPTTCKEGVDAADVTACGIPCLDSPGVTGSKIHTADEFAYTASLSEAAKRLIAAVLYMSE